MILVEDKIENVVVTVEIDENKDHHKWSGCPRLITSASGVTFEGVDVLTVIKAVKTSETVEEFEEKVQGTWSKNRLSEPIKQALNRESVEKVQGEAVKILDVAFTDDNKQLFEFDNENSDCLNCCFKSYANAYDGRFDKLDENQQIKYLVQSALADC